MPLVSLVGKRKIYKRNSFLRNKYENDIGMIFSKENMATRLISNKDREPMARVSLLTLEKIILAHPCLFLQIKVKIDYTQNLDWVLSESKCNLPDYIKWK